MEVYRTLLSDHDVPPHYDCVSQWGLTFMFSSFGVTMLEVATAAHEDWLALIPWHEVLLRPCVVLVVRVEVLVHDAWSLPVVVAIVRLLESLSQDHVFFELLLLTVSLLIRGALWCLVVCHFCLVQVKHRHHVWIHLLASIEVLVLDHPLKHLLVVLLLRIDLLQLEHCLPILSLLHALDFHIEEILEHFEVEMSGIG